jgi:hypothetical protein
MSSAFKRKTYGKVRPVPKAKLKPPSRPKVNELSQIFRNIAKSPDTQHNDLLSEAIDWWHKNMRYFSHKYKLVMPVEAGRAMASAEAHLKVAQSSKDNKEKKRYLQAALMKYAAMASPLLKTPNLNTYIIASRDVTKRATSTTAKLTIKFDKVLSLLEQAFDVSNIKLRPRESKEDRKFDHAVATLWYSRQTCKDLQQRLHREGLLAIAVDEAYYIARGMAYTTDGNFHVDDALTYQNYRKLMRAFVTYTANSESAPKTVVKRKQAKKTRAPRVKHSSILDTVSDEETKEFMSKAPVFKSKE